MELITLTVGRQHFEMLKRMVEFHDGDDQVFEHLGCTEQEWNDLKIKFGVK